MNDPAQPAHPVHQAAPGSPELLACYGGEPVLPEGPPGWPRNDGAVRDALQAVYASGDWGRYHGQQCAALAEELAAAFQPPGETLHVTLCSSGTVAVELALRGLGIGPGDEVILAGYDFPGNFRAIEAVGAQVVLVDIDPASLSVDIDQLEAAMGPATKAAIVSHLHGGLVPMRRLMDWARAHNLAILEDACQAPDARIDGRMAGTWGDVGVFSFGGSKLLTAGRGGAVVTTDPAIHQRIKIYSERGNQAFPLSELQAAVLRPQLKRLGEDTLRRAEAAARLAAALRAVPGVKVVGPTTPPADNTAESLPAYYKLGIWYDAAALGGTARADFLAAVQAEGVALHDGFRGFALRGARRCRKVGELPHSQAAAKQMTVLHHPVLLEPAATIDRVAAAIAKVASACPLSRPV